MIFAAATDHIYLDAGHVVDFANKAFELLDHLVGKWPGRCCPAWCMGWPAPAAARNSASGDNP